MKGKPEVLKVLQEMLKEELGAISQYFLHGEMCQNWGYKKLYEHTKKESINEMKHAEELTERILFLEGHPNLGELPRLNIGKDVKAQFENDLALEKNAVTAYNEAIAVCRKAGDQASADLLQVILADEEGHVDFLEEQLSLIAEIGTQNYLAQKV
jgi:bacterioferritin